jgi:hypothetical protein
MQAKIVHSPSTLCVVPDKQAINTDCNAHSTGDKIQVWKPQCGTQHEHELRHMQQSYYCIVPSRIYLGQAEDNWYKRCSRQGSKRRTPNLPYLDLGGRGDIFRLLGIFIIIPAHWIPTLTPPTDIRTTIATMWCL